MTTTPPELTLTCGQLAAALGLLPGSPFRQVQCFSELMFPEGADFCVWPSKRHYSASSDRARLWRSNLERTGVLGAYSRFEKLCRVPSNLQTQEQLEAFQRDLVGALVSRNEHLTERRAAVLAELSAFPVPGVERRVRAVFVCELWPEPGVPAPTPTPDPDPDPGMVARLRELREACDSTEAWLRELHTRLGECAAGQEEKTCVGALERAAEWAAVVARHCEACGHLAGQARRVFGVQAEHRVGALFPGWQKLYQTRRVRLCEGRAELTGRADRLTGDGCRVMEIKCRSHTGQERPEGAHEAGALLSAYTQLHGYMQLYTCPVGVLAEGHARGAGLLVRTRTVPYHHAFWTYLLGGVRRLLVIREALWDRRRGPLLRGMLIHMGAEARAAWVREAVGVDYERVKGLVFDALFPGSPGDELRVAVERLRAQGGEGGGEGGGGGVGPSPRKRLRVARAGEGGGEGDEAPPAVAGPTPGGQGAQ